MHRNHLASCVILLIATVLIAAAWGLPPAVLATIAILVVCPLMMVYMMYVMTTGRSAASEHDGEPAPQDDQAGTG